MSTEQVHVGRDREDAEPARDREADPGWEPDVTAGAGTRSGRLSPERDIDFHNATHSQYPLNSSRLTTAYLQAIAEAVGLPATGSADQIRQ